MTCDESFAKFGANMKNISKKFKNGFGDSIKKMKLSMSRLQMALSWRQIAQRKKPTSQTCKKDSDSVGDYRTYVDTDTKNDVFFRYIPAQFDNTTKTKTQAHREKCEENETESGKCSDQNTKNTPISENIVRTQCQFKTRDMGTDPESQAAIQDYLARERDLLATQYGLRAKDGGSDNSIRMRLRGGEGMSKTLEQRREKRIDRQVEAAQKKQAQTLTDIQEQQQKQTEKEQKEVAQEKEDIMKEIRGTDYKLFTNADQLQKLEAYKDLFTNGTDLVVADHINVLNQANGADTTDITRAIATMVTKIRYSTHMIKDKDNPRSLINNLGKACE